MDLGLRDKVTLVTAASRGLGFATALELAREGAQVVICGRNEERLESALAELQTVAGSSAVVGQMAFGSILFCPDGQQQNGLTS